MKSFFNNIISSCTKFVQRQVRKAKYTIQAIILNIRARYAYAHGHPFQTLGFNIRSAWARIQARH